MGWVCWGGARWHTLLDPRSLSLSPPGSNPLSLDVSRTRACSSYWLGPNTDSFSSLACVCVAVVRSLHPCPPSLALSHPTRSTLTRRQSPLALSFRRNPSRLSSFQRLQQQNLAAQSLAQAQALAQAQQHPAGQGGPQGVGGGGGGQFDAQQAQALYRQQQQQQGMQQGAVGMQLQQGQQKGAPGQQQALLQVRPLSPFVLHALRLPFAFGSVLAQLFAKGAMG